MPTLTAAELKAAPQAICPLTQRDGVPHEMGGLNWAKPPRRPVGAAYVPVPRAVARAGFFPPEGSTFWAWLDRARTIGMRLRVAQDGGKAIESDGDTAALGLWLRRQMGVADPARPITEADLIRSGVRSAHWYRFPDGTYLLELE
ncbi:Exodeoxyribonuclease V beta chain [Candidatus Hydrogenisulfobacillus filiaventi]|uniref:Exodeoxyribonuclease V beta chain n=1 Tax=Candidatus Hydrogenisulfobacillus filiaventi TaxID=2707344 RepID=A0A6F8ZIP2_9FIRM|nr:Exodeoxyribonuclease V beta chain [Candidatus Hydrogenisulfobacillus filiaventi]